MTSGRQNRMSASNNVSRFKRSAKDAIKNTRQERLNAKLNMKPNKEHGNNLKSKRLSNTPTLRILISARP